MAKSAAEKAQERLKKLDSDDVGTGSAVRHGLAEPTPTNKPVARKRRQTIDFAVADHDRLKKIAFEHNIDVGPMIRLLVLGTTEEEFHNVVSRSVGQ